MISVEFGPIEELDADTMSKVIQRTKAVNGLVMSKENIINYHERLGFPVEHMKDMPLEELLGLLEAVSGGQSRSGDGLTSGMPNGVGTAVGTSGGDSSVSNNESGGSA